LYNHLYSILLQNLVDSAHAEQELCAKTNILSEIRAFWTLSSSSSKRKETSPFVIDAIVGELFPPILLFGLNDTHQTCHQGSLLLLLHDPLPSAHHPIRKMESVSRASATGI